MKYLSIYLTFLLFACTSTEQKPVERMNDFPEVVVLVEAYVHGTAAYTGSGVIIGSTPKGNSFSTSVLTAKHNTTGLPPTGILYVTIKGVQIPCSHIYAHTRLDAAVLIIETAESLTGALIDFSPLSPLKEVYTGGYQMGFELLITEGILNYSIAKDLGQVPKELWLCTAPTFPGNSGGGVFDRETKKLIGLSVAVGSRPKSYDHVIVPHIHIFIPINVLGEWLSEVEHERQKT